MAGATVDTNIVRIQLGGHRRGSILRGYAIVDPEDSDLAQVRWSSCGDGYAAKKIRDDNRGWEYMHRIILARKLGRPLAKDELCDHINGNGFDNRRCNLRAVSNAQNLQNRKVNRTATSGIRGVMLCSRSGMWAARVKHKGFTHHCGYFADPVEAGIAAANKREELGFLKGVEK